jgi:NADH-quinone oxidoreductase subunit C
VDVTAVDWKKREPRFDVVYHFYSFSKNDRIRVKCGVADGEEVPSIAEVFLSANWSERETWDMFGIRFSGHPDLRRILTWEGFNGHPLRKDFPWREWTPARRSTPRSGLRAGTDGERSEPKGCLVILDFGFRILDCRG